MEIHYIISHLTSFYFVSKAEGDNNYIIRTRYTRKDVKECKEHMKETVRNSVKNLCTVRFTNSYTKHDYVYVVFKLYINN